MSVNFNTNRKPLIAYSLAGLADIVLLLLVFFLLTSSFIPQFGIQLNLPRTETAVPNQAQYITVSITADGTFYVEQEQVSKDRLLETIRGTLDGRTSLVIRADEKSTVGGFAAVAEIGRALNLRIQMATERGRTN